MRPLQRARTLVGNRLPSSRIFFTIGSCIFFFGIAVFLAWMLIDWFGGAGRDTIEFPLGYVEDVAVDSQGRIYVAEGTRHRVQRYSPEGEFQLGWSVPTAGRFALRITTDDRVEIATARANKLLTYTCDGEFVDGLYRQKEDRYQGYLSERETTGPYAVRRGLFPHVVNTSTGETVIDTPWPKRLVTFPFPSMLYSVIGFVFVAVGDLRRRCERAHKKCTAAAPSAVSDAL